MFTPCWSPASHFVRSASVAAFLLFCTLTTALRAEVLTWDSNGVWSDGVTEGTGTWNATTPVRWYSATNPSSTDVIWPNTTADTAVFGGAASGSASATTYSVTASGNLNVGNIIFNYATGNGTYIVAGGAAQLIFGGATPTVTVNSNTASINSRLTATSFTKDGAGTLVINNALNNIGALNVTNGILDIFTGLVTTDATFGGTNGRFDTHSGTTWTMNSLTYSATGASNLLSSSNGSVSTYTIGAGGFTVNSGTITVLAGNSTAASNAQSTVNVNGLLTMNGGTININTSNFAGNDPATAKMVLGGNVTATATATIGTAGGLGTELLDLGGVTRIFDVNAAATVVFSVSVATVNGGITKQGAGILRFSGTASNTFTGTVNVTAGTLSMSKTGGGISLAGDVTVNGGILEWTQDNQMATTSSVNLSSGFLRFNSRVQTIASLTQTGGSINEGSTNGGFLTITGTYSVTGGVAGAINSGGQWTVNTMNLASTYNPTAGSDFGLNGNNDRLTLLTIGSGGLFINGQTFGLERSVFATTPNGKGSELALNGDLTATGTNLFTFNATNTAGASTINLGSGIRTFNIISGTTTSASTVVSWTPGDGLITPTRTVVEGGLTKTGAGLLDLQADNSYIGKTTVNQGIMRISTAAGGIRDSYWLEVNAGGTFTNNTGTAYTHDGTLSGAGTVTGNIIIGDNTGAVLDTGILKPGASSNGTLESTAGDQLGTITFSNNLTLAAPTGPATSTLRLELQIQGATGNAASSYNGDLAAWVAAIPTNHAGLVTGAAGLHDQVKVTATFTLNDNGTISVVNLSNTYVPVFGDVFNLIDWATLVNNGFTVGDNYRTGGFGNGDLELPDISAYTGYSWDVSQFLNRGIVVVVPEPSRALLLVLGLAIGIMRRRR